MRALGQRSIRPPRENDVGDIRLERYRYPVDGASLVVEKHDLGTAETGVATFEALFHLKDVVVVVLEWDFEAHGSDLHLAVLYRHLDFAVAGMTEGASVRDEVV